LVLVWHLVSGGTESVEVMWFELREVGIDEEKSLKLERNDSTHDGGARLDNRHAIIDRGL